MLERSNYDGDMKTKNIVLLVLGVLILVVGSIEISRYQGRQAALQHLVDAASSVTTDAQVKQLAQETLDAYNKNLSLFSFLDFSQSDAGIRDVIRKRIGKNRGVCNRVASLIQQFQFDCEFSSGKTDKQKEEACVVLEALRDIYSELNCKK